MFPYYDHIVTATVQCPCLAGKVIFPFKGILNEIVVNLAVNSLKHSIPVFPLIT